ncbi:MAG: ABC transporter permease, partial [Duncaniella sp.]|nr:ABC transporter permease [Duncaniella sp.]
MKRKLLRQIGNEWTANIWLALELLVVSVVMWYLVDIFFTYSSLYREPRGFDISHCYLINQKKLSPKSPDYVEKESKENKDDFERLYDALESRPDIEAVASGVNAYFYNGSNSAIGMSHPTLEGLDFALIRRITPSFVRVFRLYGSRGETPEQLEKMIIENRNAFFASSNLLGSEEKEPLLHDHIGDQFDLSGDTVVLGGVFKTARYSDYSNGPFNASILVPVETRHLGDYELMVRVKEKMDVDFIDRLMKDADNYRFGNYYIASVQSFDRIRESYQREDENELIKKGIASAFLALNIFLGILGT